MGPYSDLRDIEHAIEAKVSGLRGPYKKKEKQKPKAKSTNSKFWELSEVVGSRGSPVDENKEYKERKRKMTHGFQRQSCSTVQGWYNNSI